MTTMGFRVKKIRQELQLSQEKFGEIFGSTKAYISAVENDKSKLSVENLGKLLVDYNVNLNWLFAGKGDPFLLPPFEEVKDDFEQRVKAIFKEMMEEQGK